MSPSSISSIQSAAGDLETPPGFCERVSAAEGARESGVTLAFHEAPGTATQGKRR